MDRQHSRLRECQYSTIPGGGREGRPSQCPEAHLCQRLLEAKEMHWPENVCN